MNGTPLLVASFPTSGRSLPTSTLGHLLFQELPKHSPTVRPLRLLLSQPEVSSLMSPPDKSWTSSDNPILLPGLQPDLPKAFFVGTLAPLQAVALLA